MKLLVLLVVFLLSIAIVPIMKPEKVRVPKLEIGSDRNRRRKGVK